MKKLLSLFLAAMLISAALVPVSAFASSYSDVPDGAYYKSAVENLTIYGIVSGYNGTFDPDAYVTRAEFAKIASICGGLSKEAASSSGGKRFNDVNIGYWANGYINASASNSLIVGYPNGMYYPENNIAYQEAVTVILRLLGYTSEDLGDNWPYAYLEKAKSLGILDGIQKNGGEKITRGDLCVLIDRALKLKMNGSKDELISKLDIKTTDEVLIIATKNEDKSLDYNSVKTSGGTYKLASSEVQVAPLTKAKLVLNDDGEVINSILTSTPKITATTVETVAGGELYFEDGTNSKSLSVKDATPCYKDGAISSYKDVKDEIEEGSKISFAYETDGTLSYIIVSEVEYSGPAVAKEQGSAVFASLGAPDGAGVIRDGLAATASDIKTYDVCYYQPDSNTVYVYSDKVSGIYEEAYPSKASVSRVNISGTELEIETQTAAYKLGEKSGSYGINSKITALLGRDGKIADVITLSETSSSLYGVLLSVSSSLSDDPTDKGSQENYINILNAEGNSQSYKTKSDYSDKIGCVGKITFDEEGYASFGVITKENIISGTVDVKNRKIGTSWLSDNCRVIELTYVPEYHTGEAKAQVIELSALGGELIKSQVVTAVQSGSFGDITALFVQNVTGSGYTYGILKSATKPSGNGMNSVNSRYEVFTGDGTTKTYSMNGYSNISSGVAVEMVLDGGSLVSIKSLPVVNASSKCSALDFSRIRVGGEVYSLADDALIALHTSSGYKRLSVEDAQQYFNKVVRIYSNNSSKKVGEIKVVIFEN